MHNLGHVGLGCLVVCAGSTPRERRSPATIGAAQSQLYRTLAWEIKIERPMGIGKGLDLPMERSSGQDRRRRVKETDLLRNSSNKDTMTSACTPKTCGSFSRMHVSICLSTKSNAVIDEQSVGDSQACQRRVRLRHRAPCGPTPGVHTPPLNAGTYVHTVSSIESIQRVLRKSRLKGERAPFKEPPTIVYIVALDP